MPKSPTQQPNPARSFLRLCTLSMPISSKVSLGSLVQIFRAAQAMPAVVAVVVALAAAVVVLSLHHQANAKTSSRAADGLSAPARPGPTSALAVAFDMVLSGAT